MTEMNLVPEYGMGRVIIPDYRDAGYPMALALNPMQDLPVEMDWQLGPILDQGSNPWCVAYAIEQFLQSEPTNEPNMIDVATVYTMAQSYDGMQMPHDGTTVRAGLKVLAERSLIESSYVWAYDVSTIKRYLLTRGPVVFGVTWYEGMYQPDANGLVTISGNPVGGHAFLCSGYSQHTDLFHFCNSWSQNWGKDGTFYLTANDVSVLLRDFGEVGSAVANHLINK